LPLFVDVLCLLAISHVSRFVIFSFCEEQTVATTGVCKSLPFLPQESVK
jgi:hypothetical protein